MVTALNVANNFIRRAKLENKTLSPMKLQKLIYFLYAAFYAKTGVPLFSERFGTWKYGPVLDTIYQEFREFETSTINRYCYTDKVIVSVDEKHDDFRQMIDSIWCKFRDNDGIELSDLTHKPGTAWFKANSEMQPFLDDKDIIIDGKELLNG